jgi:hypothetical protein
MKGRKNTVKSSPRKTTLLAEKQHTNSTLKTSYEFDRQMDGPVLAARDR